MTRRRRRRLPSPTRTQRRLQAANPRPWWVWREQVRPRPALGAALGNVIITTHGGPGPQFYGGGPGPAAGASAQAIRDAYAVEVFAAREQERRRLRR